MLSAPTRTPPAVSRRAITVASTLDGGRSRLILEPARVGSPAISNRFLTANGAPASGPRFVSARPSRVDRVSFGERALRGHVSKRAERAISSFDAIERLLGDLAGAHRARPDRCGDRLSRSVKERSSSCCEDRRRLLPIVERDRKKLLGLLRRDPQMHKGLSARFWRQRQTEQRGHRVHHGFRIEYLRSHSIASSTAQRRGARPSIILRAWTLSRIIARRAEKLVVITRPRSAGAHTGDRRCCRAHDRHRALSARSRALSFGAAPKC